MSSYDIKLLPLNFELETKAVLKQLVLSRSALSELKGIATTIPNEAILVNTLSLQEAKDSSAIENIITTQDDLYQADIAQNLYNNLATKEVYAYKRALIEGFDFIRDSDILTFNQILHLQSIIVENNGGYRKLAGTVLKNEKTGATVYTPPQHFNDIMHYLNNLEQFMNDTSMSDLDPLIKMALIHFQFETIHPYYDGNGRTGRIINILYLVKENLLDTPILYLSRYINRNRDDYYRLLQSVREKDTWEEWILYMLKGVEQTSLHTIRIIQGISELMLKQQDKIRTDLPKIYSSDLVNCLFIHPYTKIEYMSNNLNISRNTAIRYLNELIKIGILDKKRLYTGNYYFNKALLEFLTNVTDNYPL